MGIFVSVASAQEQGVEPENLVSLSSVDSWVYVVVGVLLALITLVMIFRNVSVTIGHSVLIGSSLAIISIPNLSNFEWTKDSVKFTTKSEASQITVSLRSLVEQNSNIIRKLQTTQDALSAVTEKVKILENSSADGPSVNQEGTPDGNGGARKDGGDNQGLKGFEYPADLYKFPPEVWSKLEADNHLALDRNDIEIMKLDILQEKLDGNI